jgi:APA family basic amino acid/polyamine antiporter
MGLSAVKATNLEPFAPSGLGGVLSSTAIIFFAYTGYARIATLGEEVKDPSKTIPRAILVSLAITAIVYVVVTTVAIGLVGVTQFSETDSPIATAAAALGNRGLDTIIIVGAGVATLSVLLSDLLSSSRTIFAMARNGDLPDALSRLKNSNPENSIIATTAIVLALVLIGGIEQIAALTSLTILLYYAVTNISALKLPVEKRIYSKAISIAGLISCIGLTFFMQQEQWIWTLVLLIPGVIYLLIRKRDTITDNPEVRTSGT